MNDAQHGDVHSALAALVRELVDGAGEKWCWVLNPSDPGLLKSIERLSAADASAPAPGGGPSIAAHVDHLRYGLSLFNRWNRGEENPFAEATYAVSWRRTRVDEAGWAELRKGLEGEAHAWLQFVEAPSRTFDQMALTGTIAAVAHLAYHLGAMRQVNRALRGPEARD
jgi:hypothetical protein